MRTFPLLVLCLTLAAPAQQRVQFEGIPGVEISNNKLELTVLTQGGALASLILRDDPERLSPLWNPIRMAREQGSRRSSFGGGTGHFVCVDGFGPVSAEERAAGMPGHGEAHTQPWEIVSSGKTGNTFAMTFRAELPLVHEVLTRTIRMVDGENVVYVESELESLLAFDRPAVWAEHATIGSPFLEPVQTVVDMSAERAQTRPYDTKPNAPLRRRLASGKDFTWPMAPTVNGQLIDLRAAPPHPDSLDHTTCLMDPQRRLVFVTALNLDKHLLLGYLFRREEYPWLQTWENYPPTLKMARGLEFSTQPYDVPRRQSISTGKMFDTPTYRWLPAKSKIGSAFLLFYTKAPSGMKKVDDVTLENGKITIEDRKAGKRIVLPASLPL